MNERDEVSDHEALQLILRVTRTVSEQAELDGALSESLREICAYTGWRVGETWMPNADRSALVLTNIRTAPGVGGDEIRAFIDESEKLKLAVGVGLPGRVFETKRREWIPDVEALPRSKYLRVDAARAAGLHAALGVPVVSNDEVLAVLVFYLDRPRAEDPKRVEIVTTIAGQIGLLIRQQYAKRTIARLEVEALSTPVLQIWESVALAPLVGALDARRVHHLLESTLRFLERNHAKALLVDVTGIPDIDSSVVKALLDLARSARLLGTRAIFTGVSPAMARALVQLEVTFTDIATEANLADGLRLAIDYVERPVTERASF